MIVQFIEQRFDEPDTETTSGLIEVVGATCLEDLIDGGDYFGEFTAFFTTEEDEGDDIGSNVNNPTGGQPYACFKFAECYVVVLALPQSTN